MAAELEEAAQTSSLRALGPAKPRRQRSHVGHEIKRLRREAEYLAMRLGHLKSVSSHKPPASVLPELTEAEIAEYDRFIQAKQTNRKLKALVAKQQELALALKCQRVMAAPNSAMEDWRITASLVGRLSKLKCDMDSVMSHAGLAHPDSLIARSMRRVDSDMALVMEKAFCWPVRCSVEQADSYLTPQFRQRMAVIRASNDAARFTKIVYFEHDQQLHELRIKMHMHKVEQADRVVYMQSSLFSLSGQSLGFVEDMIFLVRRPAFESSSCGSVSKPTPESHLVGWNRIRALPHGVASSIDRKDQALMERVMSIANNRIESNLHRIKDLIQIADAGRKSSRPSIEASG